MVETSCLGFKAVLSVIRFKLTFTTIEGITHYGFIEDAKGAYVLHSDHVRELQSQEDQLRVIYGARNRMEKV